LGTTGDHTLQVFSLALDQKQGADKEPGHFAWGHWIGVIGLEWKTWVLESLVLGDFALHFLVGNKRYKT